MGMAHHAPNDTYARKNLITDHAILRLRERLKVAGRMEHRPDTDVGNLIDVAVKTAWEKNLARKFQDRGGEGWVVDLTEAFAYPLVAILRPPLSGLVPGGSCRGPQLKSVVTIMDAAFLKQLGVTDLVLKQINTLPDLNLDECEEGAGQVFVLPERKATPMPVEPTKEPAKAKETRILVWKDKQGREQMARYLADELDRAITGLLMDGISPTTIEVFARRKYSLTVQVQEE